MDLAQLVTTRKTCKAFDPNRQIPAEQFEQLRTLLRFAPSSVNSQPWHFIVAASPAGKERLTAATHDRFAYNAPKVRNASHVVVLCVRTDLDAAHLDALVAQEDADGRFATPEAKQTQHNSRSFYVDLHRGLGDLQLWAEKQVYIALGCLLNGAAALGIDACPMEGIDVAALNAELGLAERGLSAVVMVALGYSGEGDFNAALPKSRLPAAVVISDL